MASEGVLCAGSGACAGEPSDWTVDHRHVDWLKTSSVNFKSSCIFGYSFYFPMLVHVSRSFNSVFSNTVTICRLPQQFASFISVASQLPANCIS